MALNGIKKNGKSQEKARMRHSKLSSLWSIQRPQMSSLGATCLRMLARALRTIFWHVILSDIISAADMLHWIENLECPIIAFSWDLELFFDITRRHSKLWIIWWWCECQSRLCWEAKLFFILFTNICDRPLRKPGPRKVNRDRLYKWAWNTSFAQ
jgi:hypothetical protein